MAKGKPKRESAGKAPLKTAPTEVREARVESSEAVARGLEARKNLPVESMGSWAPATNRPDPVTLLRAQERTRVKWLLPLRHARMAVSPFAFYRGAAKVMASDLGSAPDTGLKAQLCGDAHLANFGVFGTPERRLIFDVNDFDETIPGPWEWDVKRLAASLVIAARDRGFKKKDQRAAALRAAGAYREAMAQFAVSSPTDVFYASISAEDIVNVGDRDGGCEGREARPEANRQSRASDEHGSVRAHHRGRRWPTPHQDHAADALRSRGHTRPAPLG